MTDHNGLGHGGTGHIGISPSPYSHDGTQLIRQYASTDAAIDELLGGPQKYGKLTMRDDRADLFEDWLAPKGVNVEYVPMPKSYGIAVPVEGRFDVRGSSNAGTVMAHSYIALNMRDIGKFVSKIWDFIDAQREFMKSDAGIELQDYMAEHEREPLPFKFVGAFAKGHPGIMGVTKANKEFYEHFNFPNPLVPEDIDGVPVIYINEDAYKMIKGDERDFSVTPLDNHNRGIAEEYAHLFRDSFLRIAKKALKERALIREEKATKQDLIEVYGRLVEKAFKQSDKERYQKVIDALEHDVATIERYRDIPQEHGSDTQEHGSDKASLETIVDGTVEEEGSSDGIIYQTKISAPEYSGRPSGEKGVSGEEIASGDGGDASADGDGSSGGEGGNSGGGEGSSGGGPGGE